MADAVQLEILIPVYNEGSSVIAAYDNIVQSLENKILWRAYFIYDFPEDTTVPFLRELATRDPRVNPLMQTLGKGVVNALKFGFSMVHDGAVSVVMGDNSDDLETLPTMFGEYLRGAVVVASSRHSPNGRYEGGNVIKKYLSRLAGRVLYLAGVETQDPTNNFKIYSGQFLKSVQLQSRGGFELALELTIKATVNGEKVAEVPGAWRDRVSGESKFKLMKWLPHYLKWFFYGLACQWAPALPGTSAPHRERQFSPSRLAFHLVVFGAPIVGAYFYPTASSVAFGFLLVLATALGWAQSLDEQVRRRWRVATGISIVIELIFVTFLFRSGFN